MPERGAAAPLRYGDVKCNSGPLGFSYDNTGFMVTEQYLSGLELVNRTESPHWSPDRGARSGRDRGPRRRGDPDGDHRRRLVDLAYLTNRSEWA